MRSNNKINIITTVELDSMRLNYTVDFINAHPLKPTKAEIQVFSDAQDTGINIYYGIDKHMSIPAQNYFFTSKAQSAAHLNSYSSPNGKLYAVEAIEKDESIFFDSSKFAFDIFESIFYHISRYEEIHCPKNASNQAGWLDEHKQLLVRSRLQDTPVVDHLVVAFFNSILNLNLKEKTRFSLSHDVDILTRFKPAYKYYRSLLASIVYGRGVKQLKESRNYYRRMQKESIPDPYFNFESMLSLKVDMLKKHIYFMVGGNTKYDNKYKITDKDVDVIIDLAKENNYTIGLHPSYNTMSDKTMHKAEKQLLSKKLGAAVRHCRQHWLRWDWDTTPYIIENENYLTDSSIGYNNHLGFRCGTGFAYKMYDFKNETAFRWLEVPLSFMESSAIHYASKNKANLTKLMSSFFDKNRFNTHIEMNFHNSNFDPTLSTGVEIHEFYFNKLKSIIE